MANHAVAQGKMFSTASMVETALFAAAICVLAPLSIPIGPVPVSLTGLVVYISLYVLGWKRATAAYVVYLLIGLAGLPVFSNFEGGIGKLAGPTGGYLAGYIFVAIVSGIFVQKWDKSALPHIALNVAGMVLGTAILYTFGTAWFCISTGTGVKAAMALCVVPFIAGDLVKMAIAVVVGPRLGRQLKKIGD